MLYFSKFKITYISMICAIGILLALPNLFDDGKISNFSNLLPSNKINLGLDLRGGSHLLLEVDAGYIVNEKLEYLLDETRLSLRKSNIKYKNLSVKDSTLSFISLIESQSDQIKEIIAELSADISGSANTGKSFLVVLRKDNNLYSISLTETAIDNYLSTAVDQSIEIVRRRIDELGTKEPTIQRQGRDRILIQVPGLDDPERLKALLGQTAKLSFHIVNMNASETNIPSGSQLMYNNDDPKLSFVVKRRAIISGENLIDSQPGFDSQTNQPIVNFRFDTAGAKSFGKVTTENVGKPFAIVLDNIVISSPVINEPILGGSGQISGSFTVEEANDLSILLRAGALPVPLIILEERTVGPGLGADSINAGKFAAALGLLAVLVFMMLSYGLFGIFSNIALLLNIVFIVGALSLLQATLTLPGIAGIILTIGMAVDANVLIYERVREEVKNGKLPINALDNGYKRALSTILDANITTFIAAIILFQMGSGPVKGFAVTLAIGIITSLFTAFTLTRLIVSIWLKKYRPKVLPI
jgi:protein-export membrane protein SecD